VQKEKDRFKFKGRTGRDTINFAGDRHSMLALRSYSEADSTEFVDHGNTVKHSYCSVTDNSIHDIAPQYLSCSIHLKCFQNIPCHLISF
jgi:hypothetical protein